MAVRYLIGEVLFILGVADSATHGAWIAYGIFLVMMIFAVVAAKEGSSTRRSTNAT